MTSNTSPGRLPGYKGGGVLSNVWWWLWRRLMSRRCPLCGGSGIDPANPDQLPSGGHRRCPRCHGPGRVAWP